jgi:hypothetical protein
MKNVFIALFAMIIAGDSVGAAPSEHAALKPLLAVPNEIVLREDFTSEKPLEKGKYAMRQGTRWTIADGVLRGVPSSAEFQARKKDHFGYEPRISIPACPQEFIIQFDVRFIGGKPTAIVPFVEFGHHIVRVTWAGGGGARVVADTETLQLATAPEFKLEPGKWYRALAEIKGDEFVIQFAGGPTLHGKHPAVAGKNDGFGVAGNKDGTVELDNITVWSVQSEVNPGWAAARGRLRTAEPVTLKQKPPAKKKAE